MTSSRKSALVAGLLFVVADVAGFLTFSMLASTAAPDYLAQVAGHSQEVFVGVLLILTMELACSGIAVWLYPVLRKQHEALALWAVGLRGLEVACGTIAAFALLALIPLSRSYLAAGAPQASYFQTLGDMILNTRTWLRDVGGLFTWGLGAILYNILFLRSRLLPRWLAGWGIVAILLHMLACPLTLFEVIEPLSPVQILLLAPSGLQEIVLAIWLIVNGFDPAAVARLSSSAVSAPAHDLNTWTASSEAAQPQPQPSR